MRTSKLGRELITIPFSTEALKASLLQLQDEWEAVQASRDRNAIYHYLAAVFEMVAWWAKEGKAVKRAPSGVAPARPQLGKRAGTVRGSNFMHVRSS